MGPRAACAMGRGGGHACIANADADANSSDGRHPTPIATLRSPPRRTPHSSAGNPPAVLQRLVYGVRLLSDDATLDSLLGGAADEDEFDEFDEGEAAGGAGAPRELSIILDMLPPLPADKSLPFVSGGIHIRVPVRPVPTTRARGPVPDQSQPHLRSLVNREPTCREPDERNPRGEDASSWTLSELAALACGLEPTRTNHHAKFTGVPRVYSNIFVCP